MQPWTSKYAPKNIREIPQDISSIMRWLGKKPIMLYGPPGTGKTATAYIIGKLLGYEVIEMSASELRNAEMIEKKLGSAAAQNSLLSKGKILLIDDVDALSSSKDKGAIKALLGIFKRRIPTILTANNPWNKRLAHLRRECTLIRFSKIKPERIVSILRTISNSEGLNIGDSLLRQIAINSEGDIRAAINDLQARSFEIRDKSLDIFTAIKNIFCGNNPLYAIDSCEEDIKTIMLWLDENVPFVLRSAKKRAEAYEWLSLADLFIGKIIRRQHWRFLVYAKVLAALGISSVKDILACRLRKADKLYRFWLAKQRRAAYFELAEMIASRAHCSSKKALIEILPFFANTTKKD